VNDFGHPLNGRLEGYYQGLVTRVLRATGYNPKIWIRLIPSSGKRLWNQTSCTGYDPTTFG
jgi:hypothetical protein